MADFHSATYKPWPVKLYNFLKNSRSDDLDFDRLIKTARRRSGSYDLGSAFEDESLKILLKSLNEEADLSPFGQFMMKEKLLGQLENRLRAEDMFKRYPEILEQPLLPVYMITGLQRTGTTRMQRLMSSQHEARGLMSWEALYPVPLGGQKESKRRKRKTRINARAVKYFSPGFFAIHPIRYDEQEEDVLLLDINFMSTTMEALASVPTYSQWLESADHKNTYEYEVKLLKLLQWQKGGSYWVLKSPHHLEYLDVLHSTIPDLKMIWTHRELDSVIPSFMSMLHHSRSMFSNNIDIEEIKKHWLHRMSRMTMKGVEFMVQYDKQVFHVKFDDFMSDERNMIATILGIPSSEVVLKGNNYTSNHDYSSEEYQISSADLDRNFKTYLDFQNSLNYVKTKI